MKEDYINNNIQISKYNINDNNINININKNHLTKNNFHKNYNTKTSRLNPEIKYIINHTSKFNNFNLNYFPPFYPLNPIYPLIDFDSNIKINNNSIQCNKYNNYVHPKNTKKYSDSIKTDTSLDKYQETNSMSYLSTTSEGDQGINNNINNLYFLYPSKPEEKKTNKKKDENIYESITNGIRDISNCFNSNKNESNVISFACYYFCDINMNEEKEFFLCVKMKKMIDEYEKIINSSH